MINRKFRPKSFKEVVFQKLPKRVLKAIAKSPEDKPRVILLYGPMGTGKTTLARIFAYALNCEKGIGDRCFRCSICKKSSLEPDSLYYEFDASIIGKVEQFNEVKDLFITPVFNKYRVIVIDEIQTASKQTQSSMLKILESPPDNIFYVLCTTDPHKILNPLKSRCLELELTTLPDKYLEERLEYLETKIRPVPDHIKKMMISKSFGHVRNLDMQFDLYLILGDKYLDSINDIEELLNSLILAGLDKNKQEFEQIVGKLLQIPLFEFKIQFKQYLINKLASIYERKVSNHREVKATFSLIKFSLAPYGLNSLRDIKDLVLFLWALFALFARI